MVLQLQLKCVRT